MKLRFAIDQVANDFIFLEMVAFDEFLTYLRDPETDSSGRKHDTDGANTTNTDCIDNKNKESDKQSGQSTDADNSQNAPEENGAEMNQNPTSSSQEPQQEQTDNNKSNMRYFPAYESSDSEEEASETEDVVETESESDSDEGDNKESPPVCSFLASLLLVEVIGYWLSFHSKQA